MAQGLQDPLQFDENDPYGELSIEKIQRVQPYLIPQDIKRPRLTYKRSRSKGYIVHKYVRGNFLRKKQTFVFFEYKDYQVYETALLSFTKTFSDFWNTFVTTEIQLNNEADIAVVQQVFGLYNIFAIPRLMYYIEARLARNSALYLRFMTMVKSLEMGADPVLISTFKHQYVKDVTAMSMLYVTPRNDKNATMVSTITNFPEVHHVLDMLLYTPWLYLVRVHRFAQGLGSIQPTIQSIATAPPM